MKGSTNALGKKQGEVEMLNLSLLTNQLSHDDLLGATITVEYGSASKTYTWEGIALTINVPAYVDYTIKFSEVEGYRKPETVTYTAQNGNRRTLNAKYETELVSVALNADDGSSVNGAAVTINGKSHTWNGTAITQKVAFGTSYSVSAGSIDGFIEPDTQSYTANQTSRSVTLTYTASALKVNILSNQGTDATIAAVKATVNYGDTSVEVSNGQSIKIPNGTSGTVVFPEVEGYLAPDSVEFTHNGGLTQVSGTYSTEKVTVNVVSNDGSGAEGQMVNVTTEGVTDVIPNGVYIEDTDGYLWPTDMWNNKATPNGIAVVTDECQFVIALTEVSDIMPIHNSYSGTLENYMTAISDETQAKADYDGATNTTNIMKLQSGTDYAAGWCNTSSFPSGKKGFLPSLGQMWAAYSNKAAVDAALTKAGGTALISAYYWTSTFWGVSDSDNYCWRLYWGNDNVSYASLANYYRVRAFSTLNATKLYTGDETTFHTVNGGKVEFNMAYGNDYTVSLNAKEGYKTPQSQVFTASVQSRSITMEYVYNPVIDLSMQDIYDNPINQTTANCYVINKAGKYRFPLVYGNAIKNGKVNKMAYTNNGGSYSHDFVNYNGVQISSPYIETDVNIQAASAQLSIADTDGIFTDISIIEGNSCRYVQFSVADIPDTGANGIISIKDSSGIIMWNWHIWVWPDDLSVVEITNATNVKYNILPVNLGSKWDDDAKTYIKNWFYQFGRPTPLLCPSAYNSTSNHASYGVLSFTIATTASNIQTSIKNPTNFYKYTANSYNTNWFKTNSDKVLNLWDAACTTTGNSDNDVVKTIYDPCPIGFKIPNGNTFTGLSRIGNANGILKATRYSGDTVGIGFPMSGYREVTGVMSYVGERSICFLSSIGYLNQRYGLFVSESDIVPQYIIGASAFGCSIRPVQDDITDDDIVLLHFSIKGTNYRVEQGMTWGEWINSSYNTRGCYVSGNAVLDSDGKYIGWTSLISSPIYPTEIITVGHAYETTSFLEPA